MNTIHQNSKSWLFKTKEYVYDWYNDLMQNKAKFIHLKMDICSQFSLTQLDVFE